MGRDSNQHLKNTRSKKYYDNKMCVIGTMHRKEEAIASSFLNFLGLNVVPLRIDTDQFGTFTKEVERKKDPLTCARHKCELAIKESQQAIGVASEGSFGQHPYSPFIASTQEILYFIDTEKRFHLYQSLVSVNTNYSMKVISTLEELKRFCDQALFPSHALIVTPSQSPNQSLIFKGIQDWDTLQEHFFKCSSLSLEGSVLVETDMRAHMNPTRMGVIQELANSLAKRLATLCPLCACPGWGMVKIHKGLECEICGAKTDMIREKVFGCPKCSYQESQPRQDGVTQANAEYCLFCNP